MRTAKKEARKAKDRIYSRKDYQKRKDRGQCAFCQEPAMLGLRRCKKHRDRNREYARRYTQKKMEKNEEKGNWMSDKFFEDDCEDGYPKK